MYVERPVCASLRMLLTCSWTRACARASTAQIMPDACIDIVWSGDRLTVAGPDTAALPHAMEAGARYAGVRFAPGTAASVLGLPASALRDARVDLADLWGDDAYRLRDRLYALPDPARAARALEEAVEARPRTCAVDPLARRVLARLAGDATLPAARLAADLGVSERQLLRRCTAAFGYGPKLLGRVLRFQRVLRALRDERAGSLAALARTHGYADQAHLAHEVRALAGVAPSRLRVAAHRDVRSRQDGGTARAADSSA